MRAAYLLSRALEPLQVDRSGMTGHFVEVYPAAAFVQWGIKTNRNGRSYKKDAEVCADVAGDLLNRTEARDLKRQALRSDHVVDALASALVALMVDEKLVEPIPDGMEDAAEREGWIALPTGSLEKLAKKFSGS